MGPVGTVGSREQAVLGRRPCARGRWGVRWGVRRGDGGLAGSTVQSGDAAAGRAVSVGRDASDSEPLEPRLPLRGFRMLGAGSPGLASLCGRLLWALVACSAGLTPASACSLPLPTSLASLGFGA